MADNAGQLDVGEAPANLLTAGNEIVNTTGLNGSDLPAPKERAILHRKSLPPQREMTA